MNCFFFSRYIFKNQKKAGLQELGPRFTLKLRSLQRGTFDSKFGEYEWIHKVCTIEFREEHKLTVTTTIIFGTWLLKSDYFEWLQ